MKEFLFHSMLYNEVHNAIFNRIREEELNPYGLLQRSPPQLIQLIYLQLNQLCQVWHDCEYIIQIKINISQFIFKMFTNPCSIKLNFFFTGTVRSVWYFNDDNVRHDTRRTQLP